MGAWFWMSFEDDVGWVPSKSEGFAGGAAAVVAAVSETRRLVGRFCLSVCLVDDRCCVAYYCALAVMALAGGKAP
jgi:hypothetical protein